MQVSDLVGQYNNAAGQLQMTGTAGVKKLASSLREMGAGNIFEGTVNSVKGGQVVLGLSNGQTLTARIEGKVSLTVGQSMFFQVKSNDGSQIAIRPFTMAGNSVNLTLMDALKAAGIPVEGRNLSMVNIMMEEHMSIDKNSLAQMARVVLQNPEVNVGTLVQMQKLGIPITPEFVSQFENYMDDKQAIGKELERFMQELPQTLLGGGMSGEEMQKMGEKILSIVTDGLSEAVEIPEGLAEAEGAAENISGDPKQAEGQNPLAEEEAALQPPEEEEAGRQEVLPESEKTGQVKTGEGLEIQQNTEKGTQSAVQLKIPYTLGSVLDTEQIKSLSDKLSALLGQEDQEGAPGAGQGLKATDSTVAVLNEIKTLLGQSANLDQAELTRLFSGKEFQALVQDALEQQWLIRPEDLGKGDKIGRLYEKLEDQLTRMENVVKASGQSSESISQLASDIRNNVNFMNQINENYTYVQIPLKMSGQNASGELYVYTNKKSLAEKSDDVTAFLHLDMDHLGPTDVSIRLHGKEVFTKFYFDSDETYDLVEAHIFELEARLLAKGYNCNIAVVKNGKKVNFVEDFLKKDQPSAGLVHRYSFDMRA